MLGTSEDTDRILTWIGSGAISAVVAAAIGAIVLWAASKRDRWSSTQDIVATAAADIMAAAARTLLRVQVYRTIVPKPMSEWRSFVGRFDLRQTRYDATIKLFDELTVDMGIVTHAVSMIESRTGRSEVTEAAQDSLDLLAKVAELARAKRDPKQREWDRLGEQLGQTKVRLAKAVHLTDPDLGWRTRRTISRSAST
ncbi:MAG: hypothetical protein JWL72_3844 [Ilumatobacteraceae bacterium]|nr:hypothetical protein [Ilumatobacteraceae bacterium]